MLNTIDRIGTIRRSRHDNGDIVRDLGLTLRVAQWNSKYILLRSMHSLCQQGYCQGQGGTNPGEHLTCGLQGDSVCAGKEFES